MAIQASISCGAYSLSFQGWVEMAAASALPGAAPMPIIKPPATETAVRMKSRRVRVETTPIPRITTSSGLRHICGAMNGATQSFIRAATANIGNIRVDVGIRGLGILLKERHHDHDLPRLAVAALRNTFFNPRALHWMIVVWGKALNSDDLCAIKSADWQRAGPHGGSVDMHRASAALRDTAAEFCAGQTDHVAQHPEKRRIGLDVDLPRCSVDVDGDHFGFLSALKNSLVRAAEVECDQTWDALTARFAPARPPAARAAYGSWPQR